MSDNPASAAADGEPSSAVAIFLKAIRLYTFNTPIAKGKYRLYQTALKLLRSRPTGLRTATRDGRELIVDLTTGMQETVYFIGEYERAITDIAARMIGEGDICIDAGANFGWYTTLMSLASGPAGEVHAFEPVPRTFGELERNRKVAVHPAKIFTNNVALGDREGTVSINIFEGQPSGHASLSANGGSKASSYDCRMTTLDAYAEKRGLGYVNFVKADIEGAELMFLKGAGRLFEQAVPPIFLMEMALAQTRNFGYLPNDLIEHIGGRADYSFYKVDEIAGTLTEIEGINVGDIGANVFCVPDGAPARIHSIVAEYLVRG